MFKKFINKNKIIGSWITIPNETTTEILAKSNYDFHSIDLEHSSIDIHNCEKLVRILSLNNKPVFVRLTNNSESQIKKILDYGVDGIILPNITSSKQLKKILNYIYYPPLGERGVGLSRSSFYGKSFSKYFNNFNSHISIIIIIENKNAFQNIEEILSNKLIDAVMIGPYDLSASMGKAGKFNDMRFKKAVSEIKKFTKKYNKKIGFHLVDPDIKKLNSLKKEFDFIFYSLDTKLFLKSVDEL